MVAGIEIIPELALRDVAAGRVMLAQVFGFTEDGPNLMRLGNQRVALVAGKAPQHGRIDHLALSVSDTDAAAAALIARGAVLESTTPDGPNEIAEFWGTGVRYVFLAGPEGARIELCARRGQATGDGTIAGHDHIGIPCRDLAETEGFFLALGLMPVAGFALHRPEGETKVRFLRAGHSVVELYAPPVAPVWADDGLWHGLRLAGTDLPKGAMDGPDGLRLTVI